MDLKFPTPSFRVGTIRDSIYSIVSTIEYLEQDGRIQYKELGSSPDGKVTNEFHIFPTNGMAPFAIYDYKFGFDPSASLNSFSVFKASGAPLMMLVNLLSISVLLQVVALVA